MLGAGSFRSVFSSGNSIKLAAIGGGIFSSTSGEVRRNPNAQMMSSHRRAANGIGHQTRTSLALEYGILTLFVLDCYQEVLRSCGSCAQHCLHNDALWRIAICGYDQFLFRIL